MAGRTLARQPGPRAASILRFMAGSVIPCVGAVIKDARGRLCSSSAGMRPVPGYGPLPGGRVEPGETDAQALVREMREETGLLVEAGALIGTVRLPAGDGDVFAVADYAATVTGGMLAAGDDAAEARWVSGQRTSCAAHHRRLDRNPHQMGRYGAVKVPIVPFKPS